MVSRKKEAIKIVTFDSGIGGFVFTDHIHRFLLKNNGVKPYEIIHIADNENIPYGSKTPEQITQCVVRAAEFAFTQGADYFLICCNTASIFKDQAAEILSQKGYSQDIQKIKCLKYFTYELLLKSALIDFNNKKNPHYLFLATPATVKSQKYITKLNDILHLSQWEFNSDTSETHHTVTAHHESGQHIKITQYSPKDWVVLLENNVSDGALYSSIYNDIKTISHTIPYPFDAVGLFCTHYPLLKQKIYRALYDRQLFKKPDAWLSQMDAVSYWLYDKIKDSYIQSAPPQEIQFLHTSKDIERIQNVFKKLFPQYKNVTFSLVKF